jgi:predicted amidohydrolase
MSKTFFLIVLCVASPLLAKNLEVALVQYLVEGKMSWPQVEAKIENYVAVAVKQGAKVVVFPELFVLDLWPIGSGKKETDVVKGFAQHAEAYAETVRRLAKKNDIVLVGGSVARLVMGKLFNSAVIAFPDGRLFYQNKLHLTPWEVKAGFSTGDELLVFEESWGKFVVLICYDLEIPQLSKLLAPIKPELIIVPSMTENENSLTRVLDAARTRSLEHLAFVAVTGTVGNPSPDFTNVSKAIVATPPIKNVAKIEIVGTQSKGGVTIESLDFAQLREAKKSPDVYPARDGETNNVSIRTGN